MKIFLLTISVSLLVILSSCSSSKEVKLDKNDPKVISCTKAVTNQFDLTLPEWRESSLVKIGVDGHISHCVEEYDQKVVDCKIAAKTGKEVSECEE